MPGSCLRGSVNAGGGLLQNESVIEFSQRLVNLPFPLGIFDLQFSNYASSTSIFFASASSLVILKLRIWPSLRASGLGWAAGVWPFQRLFNCEESEERSSLPVLFVSTASAGT